MSQRDFQYEEFPYKGEDTWNWPVHDTPSGSSNLISIDIYDKPITSIMCGIVLCGHGYNSISHSTCTNKLSTSSSEGGFTYHAVSRGDSNYARNYFFVKVNKSTGDGVPKYRDLITSIATNSVKLYTVKNRRQILHWLSDRSETCYVSNLLTSDIGPYYRCFNNIKAHPVYRQHEGIILMTLTHSSIPYTYQLTILLQYMILSYHTTHHPI